jgi:GRAM domain
MERGKENHMKILLRRDEQIIKEGEAELQKNVHMVVGRLYLTNQRFVFVAHRYNIRGGITEIELSNIRSLEKCWTRLLGLFPIFPNSLAVRTMQGKEFRFVLYGRSAWIATLKSQQIVNII